MFYKLQNPVCSVKWIVSVKLPLANARPLLLIKIYVRIYNTFFVQKGVFFSAFLQNV